MVTLLTYQLKWFSSLPQTMFTFSAYLLIPQPLDVGVFKSLKSYYSKECRKYLAAHPGQVITMVSIAYLVEKACPSAFTPINTIGLFKKVELSPLIHEKLLTDRLHHHFQWTLHAGNILIRKISSTSMSSSSSLDALDSPCASDKSLPYHLLHSSRLTKRICTKGDTRMGMISPIQSMRNGSQSIIQKAIILPALRFPMHPVVNLYWAHVQFRCSLWSSSTTWTQTLQKEKKAWFWLQNRVMVQRATVQSVGWHIYFGDDTKSVWVCCDSCESWLDFKCAGLKNS